MFSLRTKSYKWSDESYIIAGVLCFRCSEKGVSERTKNNEKMKVDLIHTFFFTWDTLYVGVG